MTADSLYKEMKKMTGVIGFSVASICLVYLLWQISTKPCKGKFFFLRVILPFPFAIQFFSIFQYGNKTAGVPVRVTFFEDIIVHYLHLPNPTVQWISFIFCMLIIIFCFPKESQ